MLTSDFDFILPEELIAQYPQQERPASRMLVLSRTDGHCELRNFFDFPKYVRANDCLVVNDTKVMPARLLGSRVPTGGRVEALLLEEIAAGRWHAMMRPGRRLHTGDRVELEADNSETVFTIDKRRSDGTFEIHFVHENVLALLDTFGTVPLPPYIRRPVDNEDRERYQTVYAKTPGAVAAPTAGLHFTPDVLAEVEAAGATIATVTLHVGAGTFKPVKEENIHSHQMHEERFVLSPEAALQINTAHNSGGRVIAVGTTSVRVLESCVAADGRTVTPQTGRTRLFMHPPMTPRIADGLLTNFHLPRSTLLMLVSTFSSVEQVLAAYRLAVAQKMRFYSYGDCMLLI